MPDSLRRAGAARRHPADSGDPAAFAIPQILQTLASPAAVKSALQPLGRIWPKWASLRENLPTAVRSGLTGVGVGSIPGVGEDVAAWLSYDLAKKLSRRPEEYGRGSLEGVVAAETANNACIGGALAPLLTLGVPGSPPAAMLLSALLLHNVQPGPTLAERRPDFIPMMCAILLLAALMTLICGLLLSRVTVRVLRVPVGALMPIVALLSVIGAFALDNSMLNVYSMLAFGVVAWALQAMQYPIAPLVIGVILGPMADENIRLAMTAHQGDLTPFFTRPIAIVLLALIAYSIVSQAGWLRGLWRKQR